MSCPGLFSLGPGPTFGGRPRGAEINLTQQSHAFVKQVMMQAWDGMLQTKAAGRIAARGLGPDLGRLAVEGVRRILRSSRFSASEKTLGLACFTRAYWTHDVLIQMGYSPGAQCPPCPATDQGPKPVQNRPPGPSRGPCPPVFRAAPSRGDEEGPRRPKSLEPRSSRFELRDSI